MTKGEAINWLINLTADTGKAEHRDLWHYEQALTEIKEMLEADVVEVKKPDHGYMWICPKCGLDVHSDYGGCIRCGWMRDDVVEVKRGRWEWDENGMDWNIGAWRCDVCHAKPETWWETDRHNPMRCAGSHYCPNCGAKMER